MMELKLTTQFKKDLKRCKHNEDLKMTNQLEWVQRMNNIKNRAEEIVLQEVVYEKV